MKNKYIKLFSALAIIAMAMTSCQKEGTTKTLAITTENYKSDTKGYIGSSDQNNNQLSISNGDVLKINDNLYTVNGQGTNAQVSGVALAYSYTAAFPGQNSSSANNGSATITFPTTVLQRTLGSITNVSTVETPAMAYATEDSPSLKFQNCGAAIKLRLSMAFTPDRNYKLYLEEFTITNNNSEKYIAGTYTFTMANSASHPQKVDSCDLSNVISLVPDDGIRPYVSRNGIVISYIPVVPADNVQLSMRLVVNDGTWRYTLERTQDPNKVVNFKRNYFYFVPIQLGANPSSLAVNSQWSGFTVTSKTAM